MTKAIEANANIGLISVAANDAYEGVETARMFYTNKDGARIQRGGTLADDSHNIIVQGRFLAVVQPPVIFMRKTSKARNGGNGGLRNLMKHQFDIEIQAPPYAPVTPCAAVLAETGNAFLKTRAAYGARFMSSDRGTYDHLPPLQHAAYAVLKRAKAPMAFADILAAAVKASRFDGKHAKACLADTLRDLYAFGYVVSNIGDALKPNDKTLFALAPVETTASE